MPNDDLLGPYLSRLPSELALEIALLLCSYSQNNYANILRVCRALYELCKIPCLAAVSIILETPHQVRQFADCLEANPGVAVRIRRLWITEDVRNIIPQCINLTSLACNGHDLIPITSCETFQHTQLNDLTIMGPWNFWVPLVKARHCRTLCGQLQKLWLLDHLILRGVEMEWSSLRRLYYWSLEGLCGQFRDEVVLLKELPMLERLGVIMHSPSSAVFGQLAEVGDSRLEVIIWGKRNEKMEWMGQRM